MTGPVGISDMWLLFAVATGVMLVLVLARSDEPVTRLVAGIIQLALIPVEKAHVGSSALLAWALGGARTVFGRAVPTQKGAWRGWSVVGAFMYAVLVLTSLYAETLLLILSLPILGFGSVALELPLAAVSIAALAIISPALYFGGLLSDCLGWSAVGVWHGRSRIERTVMGTVSAVALSLLAVLVMDVAATRAFNQTVPDGQALVRAAELDPYASSDALQASSGAFGGDAVSSTNAEIGAEQKRLLRINIVMALLGVAVLCTGHWSLGWAVAYLYGFVLVALYVVVWPVDFVLASTAEILRALRDQLAPSLGEIAHLGLGALRDVVDRLRRNAFDRQQATMVAATERHFADLGRHVRTATEKSSSGAGHGQRPHRGQTSRPRPNGAVEQ